MFQQWTDGIERIAMATAQTGTRILGFTSPIAVSGVSEVCCQLSAIVSRSGRKVLLVDVSRPPERAEEQDHWMPGDTNVAGYVRKDNRGFDRLDARYLSSERYAFVNSDRMRKTFEGVLHGYDLVVVDIPSVPSAADKLNGVAIASACDEVFLVCLSGRLTRGDVARAMDALRVANVKVGAAILNDRFSPTLGVELARQTDRLARYVPRLAGMFKRRVLASPFLN